MGARLVGEDEDVPFEHAAQTFDVGARLVGEVAQGALTDLANLTVVLAQEDGGRRVPVGNGLDIHGGGTRTSDRNLQVSNFILHGYVLDQLMAPLLALSSV